MSSGQKLTRTRANTKAGLAVPDARDPVLATSSFPRRTSPREGSPSPGGGEPPVVWPNSDSTDNELLVELRAKRDWLRAAQSGMATTITKRRIKEIERELAARGIDLELATESKRVKRELTRWYVIDIDERSARDRMLHLDRGCLHLGPSKIGEATDLELERLKTCSACS